MNRSPASGAETSSDGADRALRASESLAFSSICHRLKDERPIPSTRQNASIVNNEGVDGCPRGGEGHLHSGVWRDLAPGLQVLKNLLGLDRLKGKTERPKAYVGGRRGRAQGEGREELIVALARPGFDQRGDGPEYCPLPRDPVTPAAGFAIGQSAYASPQSLGGRLKNRGRICKRNAADQQRGNARYGVTSA